MGESNRIAVVACAVEEQVTQWAKFLFEAGISVCHWDSDGQRCVEKAQEFDCDFLILGYPLSSRSPQKIIKDCMDLSLGSSIVLLHSFKGLQANFFEEQFIQLGAKLCFPKDFSHRLRQL